MLIIGERINYTRAHIQEAIKARNSGFLVKEARRQIDAGAGYIDVNCAMSLGDEVQDIDWVVSVIQSEIGDVSICIDSPNYLAIKRALEAYRAKGRLFINSITGEGSRIDLIVPLAVKYNTALIALTMGDGGMPNSAEERFAIAKDILAKVSNKGFKAENLYFDPLIRPIATEPEQAREFLRSIPMIKSLGARTICGLSNISYGLPDRKVINSTFLAMAIQSGLDGAILDPTEKQIISSISAAQALICEDEYCAEYIKAFREGRLV
ncbi:MAG: dihydropteroate synthase [Candidatus Omnitrophica bacterium]|nr:dihydropteroate synthase [Candidatus Omnitrophota bacterium]